MEELVEALSFTSAAFDFGLAQMPYPGEPISGDKSLVITDTERTLLAAIDGVGHGLEAAVAAELAAKVLSERWEQSLESQLRDCHQALRSTRGAAISLVSVEPRASLLKWVAVGDVAAFVIRLDGAKRLERRSLTPTAGIVGYGQLNAFRLESVSLSAGDVIVLATDGVEPLFFEQMDVLRGAIQKMSAQGLAERLLTLYRKGTDDALILVARYCDGGSR